MRHCKGHIFTEINELCLKKEVINSTLELKVMPLYIIFNINYSCCALSEASCRIEYAYFICYQSSRSLLGKHSGVFSSYVDNLHKLAWHTCRTHIVVRKFRVRADGRARICGLSRNP